MKKLYPLLSVLFLIYWGCLDPLNIFDFNDEETDPSVNLWGVDYSIENTTVLNLGGNGLTGSIPSEIGNLTNLTYLNLTTNQLTGEIPPEIGNLTNLNSLYLDNNQLSGIIPDEICNQGDSSPSLSNNQFCLPYPSCVEDYVGLQDVCSCGLDDDEVVYLWGNCYSIEYTTELDLSNSGLTGEIPSEIGNLTNLTELDLSENQLTGSIPPGIGNLINLSGRWDVGQYWSTFYPGLNLSDNLLTGSIPPEIGNLTNLTGLDLNNNQLTGSIPPDIGNLTNLTRLDLGSNQLTGSIPSEIGNLTNLYYLNLFGNQLRGVIPESICELTNLTWYSSTLDWFTSISSIGNNQLCPPYPVCLEGNYNNFIGTSVPIVGEQEISNCEDFVELWGVDYSIENTTELDLGGSGLTGEIPPEIGNLTNLERLYLHQNQLTGYIPQEIGDLTNLTKLDLSNNQFTGIIPDEICNQGDSSPSLYNNQLCPPYPSCVEDYVGEQDTSDCEDFVELWGEYYSIENTTELDLGGSGLTGEIPPEIGNLTNLTRLYLGSNQLTGSIPSEIGNLINLTHLYLEDNQLSGSIPSEIGNLTNLTRLYSDDNQLTGSIPSEIGNLTNLRYLNLNDNELTGSIPPETGNLTNLTYLNLKSNQLSGIIPDEICNQGDSSPNLSNNQLCPPYPSCIEDNVGEQDTSDCD
jgi:Leucine-rich repeat (LRR) protein